MPDKLSIPPDEVRAIAAAAVDFMTSYFENLAANPVVVPTTSQALREALDEPLPQSGSDFQALLDIRPILSQ